MEQAYLDALTNIMENGIDRPDVFPGQRFINKPSLNGFRFLCASERHSRPATVAIVDGHIGEGPALLLQGSKVLVEDASLLGVLRIGQMYQAMRIEVRKRAQNHGLNDAEDRSVGSDAKAKCEKADCRVTGRPAQLANPKAYVLCHYL